MHHTRVLLSYDIYIKPYFKLYNCAGQHRTTEYDTYYRRRPHVNFTQGNRSGGGGTKCRPGPHVLRKENKNTESDCVWVVW